MLKRLLSTGLTLGLVVWNLSSCGSSYKPPPPAPGAGALITIVGDAPVCDVVAIRPTITGLTVALHDGSGARSLVSSASPPRINFADLRDFSGLLSVLSLPVGTYDTATITLALASLTVFDSTQSPPTKIINVKLPTLSPKFTIQPPVVITANKASAMRVDFDLLRSVQVDSQGQVTGNVTPVFNFIPLTASGSMGFGELDGLSGFVRSVTPTSPGAFVLQTFGGTGAPVSVNVTSSTQLRGVPSLSGLSTGSFVDVDALLDANGNVVANSVEVEDQENIDKKFVAFIGPVTALTRDSNGNVTQFNLAVIETEPDASIDVGPDSAVVVNTSSSTGFQFSSRGSNFANLPANASTLAVGQEVVVHGTYTVTKGQPTTVAADKVYLKLNSVQGNFTSLVQAATDDRTGAFQLSGCSTILSGTPVLVLTSAQTAFVGVSGLRELTAPPNLLVKGLPFFQNQATTVNGVAVLAGTLVILAKQVHQL